MNEIRNVREREHFGEAGSDISEVVINGRLDEREWDDVG